VNATILDAEMRETPGRMSCGRAVKKRAHLPEKVNLIIDPISDRMFVIAIFRNKGNLIITGVTGDAMTRNGCFYFLRPQRGAGRIQVTSAGQHWWVKNSTDRRDRRVSVYAGGPSDGGGGGGLLQGRQTSGAVSADNAVATMVPTYAPAMKESAAGGAGASPDYSHTNVQVEGVDEADFVKNDGEFIYLLNQGNLVIVDASPADEADIVSTTEIEGNPGNIFVRGDSLVVFSTVTDYAEPVYGRGGMPMRAYTPATHAFFYSVKDRKNPVLVEEYSVDGDYFNARMIGDVVYLITKTQIYRYNGQIEVPVVSTGRSSLAPDVYYFDHPEPTRSTP
jgi:hypothetical protein